jgi:succinate-semialdehyde dehydrogenase / glutarate-semialdehyde dehydrogenase
MVDDAKSKGATCLMGGAPHAAGQLFYQPTILTGVQTDMALFQVIITLL